MLLAVLLFAAAVHWPPAIPDVKPSECKVYDGVIEGHNFWHVTVKLKFPDGTEHAYLFSVREGNERRKALLDCNDFMAHYEKHAKKEAK